MKQSLIKFNELFNQDLDRRDAILFIGGLTLFSGGLFSYFKGIMHQRKETQDKRDVVDNLSVLVNYFTDRIPYTQTLSYIKAGDGSLKKIQSLQDYQVNFVISDKKIQIEWISRRKLPREDMGNIDYDLLPIDQRYSGTDDFYIDLKNDFYNIKSFTDKGIIRGIIKERTRTGKLERARIMLDFMSQSAMVHKKKYECSPSIIRIDDLLLNDYLTQDIKT